MALPHTSHWSGTESIDSLSPQAENLQASDLLVLSQVFQLPELCVGHMDASACLLQQVVLKTQVS